MPDALQTIDEVSSRATADLAAVRTADQLEQWRIRYLGSNGEVKNLMQLIKTAPPDQRKNVGQRANAVQDQMKAGFEARKTEIAATQAAGKDALDVTEPGRAPLVGNRHILMKVADELTDLFARMGFSTASGPEVEDEFHNFIALNIPEQHPARDPLDNFYLTPDDQSQIAARLSSPKSNRGSTELAEVKSQILLRTQTSTVQIRVMERQKPPIRVVIPGRVYRPDTVDATHLFQFYQLEALVIDKNVTMVDLKSTIMQFVRAYFGSTAKIRFRPSFFPFTEPS
ncbi:MAG TPA: phenylalanine--tRNA ligase subunit alpha, partial [Tepidisphaeraceae bacterium]|nr:phenylalanine--tRNA ligase subunit alpha [Tepidisphaeraceae bacterium]